MLTTKARATNFTDRQQEIVQAAIGLIAKGGIQELTIKNLAGAIGISEPALYRHFESKQAILQGLLDFFASGSRAVFERAAVSDQSAGGKLQEVLAAHFDQFAKYPPLSAVIFSEELFQNDGLLSKRVQGIMEAGQGALLRMVREGIAAGDLRSDLPAEHLVTVIMGSLRLTVTRWRLSKYGFDLRREGKALCASLRALLSPRP